MPPQMQTTAIQMLGGGIFSLIMSLFLEPHGFAQIVKMTPLTYTALAYLIVMGSPCRVFGLCMVVTPRPPTLTATYAYVNLVVAMILSGIFVHEQLSSRSLVASLVVLIGVVLITLGRRLNINGRRLFVKTPKF
ncbi:MAG: EamA family transporter [Spirosomataceae bacterium]